MIMAHTENTESTEARIVLLACGRPDGSKGEATCFLCKSVESV